MTSYRNHLLHLAMDDFISRLRYMGTHLAYGIRCAIGQISTLTHQIWIEKQRYGPQHLDPKHHIC
eukprot:c45842_g1_i1 orf=108-302(+)